MNLPPRPRPSDRRRVAPPADDLTAPPDTAYAHGREVRVIIGADSDDLVVLKTGTNRQARVAVEREALVLGQIRHPNVIELLRTEKNADTVTLVTGFAGRTTLAQLRPVDAASVARAGAALLTVISELHYLGWAHGRIRSEHCILGSDGRLTLCAFGAAHRVSRGDDRPDNDRRAAIAVIDELAARLDEPKRRSERRDLRDLQRVLSSARDGEVAHVAAATRQLAALGGHPSTPMRHVSPPLPEFTSDDPATTGPSLNGPIREDVRTRARPLQRSWSGTIASLAIAAASLTAFIGVIAFLRWVGGPLSNPVSLAGVGSTTDLSPAVAVALGLVRIAALGACLYGIALSAATIAAIITRRPDLARIATSMAPPRLRRALVVLIGLGIIASVATPKGHTSASPASLTTVATSTPPATTTTTTVPPPTIAPAPPPAIAPTPEPTLAALPQMWVIEPGDHLWGIAAAALAGHLGRTPSDREIDPYWRSVIDLNRESLVDPDDPDLVIVGQVIELPPLT